MKKVIMNGIETVYEVSEQGEVYNTRTGRCLEGTVKRNEYRSVQLTIEGKAKSIMVHRLVAQTYLPNPNNLPIVHHKDGDKMNNCVDNLEWTTYQENSLEKFHQSQSGRRMISTEGKEWKQIVGVPFPYEISENGMVRGSAGGTLMKGSLRNGYVRYNLRGTFYTAHRLVYLTFVGEIPEGYVIDHIDGDRQNNDISNLRCVSQSENMINAQSKGHKGQRKVAQYDLNNNFIKEFPSFTAAAKEVRVTSSAISSAAKRNGTSRGFKWKEV